MPPKRKAGQIGHALLRSNTLAPLAHTSLAAGASSVTDVVYLVPFPRIGVRGRPRAFGARRG